MVIFLKPVMMPFCNILIQLVPLEKLKPVYALVKEIFQKKEYKIFF